MTFQKFFYYVKIKFINKNPEKYNANVLYSTPSIYVETINKQKDLKLTKKFDDLYDFRIHLIYFAYLIFLQIKI